MSVEMQPEFVLNILRRQCVRGSIAFKKLSVMMDALYLLRCEENGYSLSEEELERLPAAHEVADNHEFVAKIINEQFDVLSQVSDGLSAIAESQSVIFGKKEDEEDGSK